MIDPNLRIPFWLTHDQRHKLGNATLTAIQNDDADIDLCQSLLHELLDAGHRETASTRLVSVMIERLRLPDDITPVFLCEAEISQVVLYGDLDRILVGRLQPQRGKQGGQNRA